MKYKVRYRAVFEENVHASTPGGAMNVIRIPERGGRYIEGSCVIEGCEKVPDPSEVSTRGERTMTKKERGVTLDVDNVSPDGDFLWLDVVDGKGRACSVSVLLSSDDELSFEVYDEPRQGVDKDHRVYDDREARFTATCTDPFAGLHRGGETTEILIHAWEPNGDNAVGGFDWTYMNGGEDTNEVFLARMNAAILRDATTTPESGGMLDLHYVLCGYAPNDMGAGEVTRNIEQDAAWLAKGRLKEPYVVGQPLKLEPDPG